MVVTIKWFAFREIVVVTVCSVVLCSARGAGRGARWLVAGRWQQGACWLLLALALAAAVAWSLGPAASWPHSLSVQDGATYDYIVVGAGAAGCVVAGRLAQGGRRVLLLEAGPADPGLLPQVPAAAVSLLGSALDWQYPMQPNNMSCLASVGGACRYSAGRALGGSTAINYMLHSRGNRADYEYALPGWSWPELEPYFLRAEGVPPSARHHAPGPLKPGYFVAARNPWGARLYRAYRQLGFSANTDVDGASQLGVTRLRGHVYGGERVSAARAYLLHSDVAPHLHVGGSALCTRVLLDARNVARGVLVQQGARELRVWARREVVLSAGAIGSPHLLMLSGVGPARHLAALGVPPRVDLPVGEGLVDHVLPLLAILVDEDEGLASDVRNLFDKMTHVLEYLFARSGPLASVGLSDISAFVNTQCVEARRGLLEARRGLRNVSAACEVPSVQYIHWFMERHAAWVASAVFRRGSALGVPVLDKLAAANARAALLLVAPVLLAPASRGRVQLASRDPRHPPHIYPDYLADERDVDELVRGIGVVRRLVRTRAFRSRGARLLRPRLAGCGARGYWRCYARHMTVAGLHAAGTCALGRVLDTRLRVRGVRRLRVADCSALPRPPRGNTQAAAAALGERLAHFLTQDWGADSHTSSHRTGGD